jgi:dipeptidyl aminopeptidase/acylaminoacyl peptidase
MAKITVEDLFKIKSVSSVEMLGNEAVFTLKEIDGEKNRYITNIYLYSGGEIRKITSGNSDSMPKWHPLGKGIFFVSRREENQQIYFLRRDGGEAEKITNLPECSIFEYTVSPDGKLLAWYLWKVWSI